MKIIRTVMHSVFILLMIGVVGLFLIPMLPLENNFELRVVQSGSMEPSITTGSLVAVIPQEQYKAGDVITFGSEYSQVPTTHRVVEIYQENGETWLVTKGDANEEVDGEAVPLRDVRGTVVLTVPRVGYILDFTRQPIGFVLLIVLPALLIIFSELGRIWRELRRHGDRHDKGNEISGGGGGGALPDEIVPIQEDRHLSRMMDIATPVVYPSVSMSTGDLHNLTMSDVPSKELFGTRGMGMIAVTTFIFLIGVISLLSSTVSYFHDSEVSSGNTLKAIALDFTATTDSQTFDFAEGGAVGNDGSVLLTIQPETGSEVMRYGVTAAIFGSSTPLCAVLVADATVPAVYNGLVTSLQASDITFTNPWAILFSITDDSGLIGGEACTIDLQFTAWHFDVSDEQGYFDEEVITLQFNYLPTVILQAVAPTAALIEVVSTASEGEQLGVTGGEELNEPTDETSNNETETVVSDTGEGGDPVVPDEEVETESEAEEQENNDEEGSTEDTEEVSDEVKEPIIEGTAESEDGEDGIEEEKIVDDTDEADMKESGPAEESEESETEEGQQEEGESELIEETVVTETEQTEETSENVPE